jgi:thiol:disulfide interchange protein
MDEEKILYDPMQDPRKELKRAVERAKRENKNILVEAGADWCMWCHRLEQFITSHAELHQLRSQQYVHVRLFSGEGDGDGLPVFFGGLPFVDGIPHYFVYNQDGNATRRIPNPSKGRNIRFRQSLGVLAYWAKDPAVH